MRAHAGRLRGVATASWLTNDIQTIADLKGRSVAFRHRSVSQFYVNVLLKEVGLSEADIEVVDLRAEEAAEAFMMQEVDAAVTWEPYLSQGRNVAHGHLLTDTSERPGFSATAWRRSQASSATAKGSSRRSPAPGMRRCAMSTSHPAEANEIMARAWATGSQTRRW